MFRDTIALKKHMKNFLGEKKYFQCSFCDKVS